MNMHRLRTRFVARTSNRPGAARRRTLLAAVTGAVVGLLTIAAPSYAAPDDYKDITQKAGNNFVAPNTAPLSAKRAATIARRHVDGRVLAVKPRDGRSGGFRVRMLAEGGRVVTLNIDGQGRLVNQ